MDIEHSTPPPPLPNVFHLLVSLSGHPSLYPVTLPALLDFLHWQAQQPFSEENVALAVGAVTSMLEVVEAILAMDEYKVRCM